MLESLLRRVARRCETHDRASYAATARLEQEAGIPVSPAPASLADELANPDLVDCGKTWCQRRR